MSLFFRYNQVQKYTAFKTKQYLPNWQANPHKRKPHTAHSISPQ